MRIPRFVLQRISDLVYAMDRVPGPAVPTKFEAEVRSPDSMEVFHVVVDSEDMVVNIEVRESSRVE